MNTSVSAKMLAGTKAFHKTKLKENGDKISLNDLIHKKKNSEHIKKQKWNIWKQVMNHKPNDVKDKLIRF